MSDTIEIPVSMAGKTLPPVKVMHRPSVSPGSPGFFFAVFSANPEYHKFPTDDWTHAAHAAIERAAAQHNFSVTIRPEPLRPLNVMGEYK